MTSSAPFGFIQKQILVGSSSAGKSSLLIRLTDQRFLANSEPTLGVEFGCRLVSLPGGEVVKLQCWDTAGQEAFRSITRSYYRGAAGALLVFDLTHRPSFAACPGWLADLRAYGEEDLLVLLVGTKGDLCDASDGDKRATTRAEAEAFARDEGLVGYVETSALSGQGVEEVSDLEVLGSVDGAGVQRAHTSSARDDAGGIAAEAGKQAKKRTSDRAGRERCEHVGLLLGPQLLLSPSWPHAARRRPSREMEESRTDYVAKISRCPPFSHLRPCRCFARRFHACSTPSPSALPASPRSPRYSSSDPFRHHPASPSPVAASPPPSPSPRRLTGRPSARALVSQPSARSVCILR